MPERAGYAGLVTRFAALVVDALLLTVAVPVVAIGPPGVWASLTGAAPGWLKAAAQIVGAVLPLAYFALCWWGTGQTLGGLLFGVVVRRRTGAPLGAVRAVLRALVGLLLPLLWLVGMVTVLTDARRRALHDRVFGTVVVRKSRLVAAVEPTPVAQPAR